MTAFVLVDNFVILLQVACIAYCHFKVYFQFKTNCRSTSYTRDKEKVLKDQRAFKVTSLTIAMILLCSLPTTLVRLVTTMFPLSLEQKHVLFFPLTAMSLFNSFIVQCPIKGVQRSFYLQDNLHVEPQISLKLKKTKCETSGFPALG